MTEPAAKPRLRMRKTPECPPDGYRVTIPGLGPTIRGSTKQDWFEAIANHYRMNGLTLPLDYREAAEDQLCQSLESGWCFYDDGTKPKASINVRFGFADVIAGSAVFIEWVKQGKPLVSKEVAEERAAICAACYANVHIPGCGGCHKFAEFVMEIVGSSKTKSDAALENKGCAVCKCSSKANVWMPVEVSRKGVTEEMMGLWPRDWCWKGKELRALANSGRA